MPSNEFYTPSTDVDRDSYRTTSHPKDTQAKKAGVNPKPKPKITKKKPSAFEDGWEDNIGEVRDRRGGPRCVQLLLQHFARDATEFEYQSDSNASEHIRLERDDDQRRRFRVHDHR